MFHALPFSEPFAPEDCLGSFVIDNLAPSDFHLFEDGAEQKIESVRYEREAFLSARDSRGDHAVWSHTPRGIWNTIDLGNDWGPAQVLHFYRLAYVPAKPEEGKCYKVKVKVDRHNAAVYATDQYCYSTHPASDPLGGTKFEKQMETDMGAHKRARIPMSTQNSFLYTGAQRAKVDILLEFPWNLTHEWVGTDLHASIGVVGVVDKKDGTEVTRFSDFACCSSGSRIFCRPSWFEPFCERGGLPSRYETQIDLPAGAEYDLRVVLSDGVEFGRAEIPLDIDSYDGKQLAISSVILSNRFREAKAAAEEAAAVNLAPAYVPLVSRGLQFTPAAHRSFKSTEHLTAYFEVYEPLLTDQPKTQVQAHVRIVDAQTGQTRFQFAPIDATPNRRPGSTTLAVAGDLPLAQLGKGNYLVEAQATDSAGRSTVWRTASFTIETEGDMGRRGTDTTAPRQQKP